MERKVGEIFEYNGEWYQCVEGIGCYRCAFYDKNICIADNQHCTCRSDKKNVIFKKLEKVGEPYKGEGKIFQPYQAYIIPVPKWDYEFFMLLHQETKIIDIEVKQNKENMEEKKLSLKPFDLEAAKAGKPVCTRDGRKVRIISFDRKFLFKGVSYPIIALVEDTAKEETIYGYNEKGKVIIENDTPYKDDLMMLPQKKEGWVNVYKSHERGNTISFIVASIYPTKEEAKKSYVVEFDYVDTVKIEWEE